MKAEIAVLKQQVESLNNTLRIDLILENGQLTGRLEEAFTEHIRLIRENGELQQKLHTLTAKKLPIKKSKNK